MINGEIVWTCCVNLGDRRQVLLLWLARPPGGLSQGWTRWPGHLVVHQTIMSMAHYALTQIVRKGRVRTSRHWPTRASRLWLEDFINSPTWERLGFVDIVTIFNWSEFLNNPYRNCRVGYSIYASGPPALWVPVLFFCCKYILITTIYPLACNVG